MNFTPSSGNELQTEYFVAREKGFEAIEAVESLRDRITPLLFVTEFRTIAADQLWMSPCRERDSMTIHFTWKPEWPQVRDLLPHIEENWRRSRPSRIGRSCSGSMRRGCGRCIRRWMSFAHWRGVTIRTASFRMSF